MLQLQKSKSMALSKLKPRCFFPSPAPLPIPKSPTPRFPRIPFKNPLTLRSKIQLTIPVSLQKLPLGTSVIEEEEAVPDHQERLNSDFLSVAFPSLAFSNTLFFSSAYNVQLIPGDNEPEEQLIRRFRREVWKAGVVQECKRRRFFESTQEKRKRKTREAAKRNRKRHPRPRVSSEAKAETSEKKKKHTEDSDDDNWEFLDVDLPYC